MENRIYSESNFKRFLRPYENFFHGLKNVYPPNSGKKNFKKITSYTSSSPNTKDSRMILEDYRKIGNDMKVAIRKYESSRK